MLTLKNKYGRQKPIVQGLEGVRLGGSVLCLNPECRILNPENTVPHPHNWRYAKSIPPQIAIEQNGMTERKKNKMGTKKMKLQLKIVFRINPPPPPTMQTSINFRSFVQLYLRSRKASNFTI